MQAWTDKDVAQLKKLAGKIPVSAIASTMGRSVGSIHGKARYLNLNLDCRPDFYSVPQLAKLLKVSRKTVNTWIDQQELQCHRFNQRGKCWVTPDQLKIFFWRSFDDKLSLADWAWDDVAKSLTKKNGIQASPFRATFDS